MTSIIDLVGSTIIGATVIGVLIAIMFLLSASSQEITAEVNVQETMADFVKTVQWDFAKIGNRVSSGSGLLVASADMVIFRGDIDNNGTIDTVAYLKGKPAQRTGTPNPRDFMLYRLIYKAGRPDTTRMGMGLTNFTLSYFDSTGAVTSNPSLVRGLNIAASLESPYSTTDNQYPGVAWQSTIYPRNLNVSN
ncbi:MAG: hypothetical protein HW412_655 [Bacteroidetes bacterium]|nr:hypothetical protein [Bacteroidota bacterium]